MPFTRDAGSRVCLLTQHYYRARGDQPGATVDALFGGLPSLVSEMAELVAAARRNGITQGFRMIETNSFVAGGSPGVSDTMAAALWALDYILRAAEVGVNGLNFQVGRTGSTNTPLVLGPGAVLEVRPEFYALALVASLGPGRMLRTVVGGNAPGLSAFAVRHDDGRLSVVLNNKQASAPCRVRLASGTTASQAKLERLTAPSIGSKEGVTLGGATIARDGTGEPAGEILKAGASGQFVVDLPAASAAWLTL